MKKTSLSAIYTALTAIDFDKDILAELETELNKDKARKDANVQAYEDVKEFIFDVLSDTPATCGEIYDALKDKLPVGFGKGKVQYALTHLWQDEIVKIEGKPNTYRKA